MLRADKRQTNPRYEAFRQTIFTAGDEEQFEQYRDPRSYDACTKTIKASEDCLVGHLRVWEGFCSIQASAVIHTFRYVFNKMKKGIFVKIAENQLKAFLPFSKASFANEWGETIRVDPARFRNVEHFMRRVSELDGRRFHRHLVNLDPTWWYANNGLVRYERPISEGETKHLYH